MIATLNLYDNITEGRLEKFHSSESKSLLENQTSQAYSLPWYHQSSAGQLLNPLWAWKQDYLSPFEDVRAPLSAPLGQQYFKMSENI